MQTLTPWQRWGRTTLLGSIALASGWSAFVASSPVPLFDWFDLGVHEAGHLVAAPLSEIAMFMAGSFAQIAFPLAMAWYFGIRRRDRDAGGFCLAWAGASAWDVSVYAGDAVTQSLPLVGGDNTTGHTSSVTSTPSTSPAGYRTASNSPVRACASLASG